jgi:hypothetical protein
MDHKLATYWKVDKDLQVLLQQVRSLQEIERIAGGIVSLSYNMNVV